MHILGIYISFLCRDFSIKSSFQLISKEKENIKGTEGYVIDQNLNILLLNKILVETYRERIFLATMWWGKENIDQ